MLRVQSFILAAVAAFITSSVSANDTFLDNFSTDRVLLENVAIEQTLENGMAVYSWDWTEAAIDLGMDQFPNVGFIAQEIESIYPEAIEADANGYSMINMPILMELDDTVANMYLGGDEVSLVPKKKRKNKSGKRKKREK